LLTIADIDEMFPDTREGTVYATLYKECYGRRPKGLSWSNIDEFLEDLEALTERAANEDSDVDYDELDTLHGDVLSVEIGYKPSSRSNWDWD
jgi:hypothetical protein